MNKYEIMFIVKPDVEEEARNTLIENFKSILTVNGGSVDNVNEWGLRDFAYEIKGRISTINQHINKEIQQFLQLDFNYFMYGKSE